MTDVARVPAWRLCEPEEKPTSGLDTLCAEIVAAARRLLKLKGHDYGDRVTYRSADEVLRLTHYKDSDGVDVRLKTPGTVDSDTIAVSMRAGYVRPDVFDLHKVTWALPLITKETARIKP